MDSILQILDRLNRSGVPYVLIGGAAARAHGSTVNTEDIDICVLACEENFRRIVAAFADQHPRYRMRPDQPPLTSDHPWLTNLKNLYLHTDLGQLDILGDIPEVGDYDAICDRTVEIDLAGVKCRVLDIPTLIEAKRRAGRPKDHQAVTELRHILERIEQAEYRAPSDRQGPEE
jgi:predicted nucleotidyltransferase